MFIAAAGPASNIVLATMASVVMRIVPVTPMELGIGPALPVWSIAATVFEINLLLAVFNMVPVPPLDGGNVLAGHFYPEALPARTTGCCGHGDSWCSMACC